jgi:hypothetical protein
VVKYSGVPLQYQSQVVANLVFVYYNPRAPGTRVRRSYRKFQKKPNLPNLKYLKSLHEKILISPEKILNSFESLQNPSQIP